MAILTIEIPNKAAKTMTDLVELLGGRIITTDSNLITTKIQLKEAYKNELTKTTQSSGNISTGANVDLEAIVFMKFGYHALEGEDDIIKRKKLEFKNTGKMFWGYGGNSCHPEKQVQQFVKEMHLQGKKVFLAMAFTNSKSNVNNKPSLKYSIDRDKWVDVPDGIKVTGSSHAIVCSELLDCGINLNLSNYEVAIGNLMGKKASDYIKGQSDKGCFIKSKDLTSVSEKINNSNNVKISLLAEIVEPYAVFMSKD